MKVFYSIWICVLCLGNFSASAQEILAPLNINSMLFDNQIKPYQSKKIRLNLPFIEDFSYEGPYPDATKWQDKHVFINNTFSNDQVTQGVATFDGLRFDGRPHMPFANSQSYADSLTSETIDLSSYSNASNIYMSFYVQPQGLSFAPELNDSLLLFFKNNTNSWEKVWQQAGSAFLNFELKFVPIQASRFYHSDFQFRFVNIASLNVNDDIWNLDYIKIDANRTNLDTNMNDVAFTREPTSFLSPYTSMPYRHFIINQNDEKTADQTCSIKNNYNNTITLSNTLNTIEPISASLLNTASINNVTMGAKAILPQVFSTFNVTYVAPSPLSKVVFKQTYNYAPINSNDLRRNDTIVRETIFDNYFSYDDGSAEKSYFLLPAPNFASKLALKFHLNQTDTFRGMMVNFGAQLPSAAGKYFSIVLYQSLGSMGSNDSIILQEDLFQVKYDTLRGGFWSYALAAPKVLNAGDYYLGVLQPANFGSDSIYYGFDVNTNTSSQFLFYNVQGSWQASTVNGSVMIRPIVGAAFRPSAVQHLNKQQQTLHLFPNPCKSIVQLNKENNFDTYVIYSAHGQIMKKAKLIGNKIDLSPLQNGHYLIQCYNVKGETATESIIKQD